MWGHSGSQCRHLATGGTTTSSGEGSTAVGRRASPGSTGEQGGLLGRRKEAEGEGETTGDDSGPSSPPSTGTSRDEPLVVKACDEGGDRKGGSCDKMEGGGYFPAHPNHHGHGGGGGVHQPLVRGGGYPGGPLEEGEVRRRGGPGATTRDGVVIIERRPSQEGIQPADMQVLKSPDLESRSRSKIATNLAIGRRELSSQIS